MKKISLITTLLTIYSTVYGSSEKVDVLNLISDDRNSINLIVNSLVEHGLICSGLSIKVKLEKPRIYMSAGEFERKIEKFFVYPKQETRTYKNELFKDILVSANLSSDEQIIIKDIDVSKENFKCKKASFHDYCRFAHKDTNELFSIKKLGQILNKKSCYGLHDKFKKRFPRAIKHLNLNNSNINDFRFLDYLGSLKSVSVKNTLEDQSKFLYRDSTKYKLRLDFLSTQQDNEALDIELRNSEIDQSIQFNFKR